MRHARALLLAPLVFACGSSKLEPAAAIPGSVPVPPGFPPIAVPADNPYSEAKRELGRRLFYDPRLSGNGTQACASCHEQARAFADGRRTPVGSTGQPLPRNAQGLANVGYAATLTWANPLLTTLEQQILVPLFADAPVELGAHTMSEIVLERLAADNEYQRRFDVVFGGTIDWPEVVSALATFCRSLVSGGSPFDRLAYGGERSALDASALRGMELFFSERLECHHCHGGFNFSESSVHADQPFEAARFHNTGLYDIDGRGSYPPSNTGLFEITFLPEDMGRFRPPSLRNVAVTAPYMHDGSIPTLEEVIRHYERGGRRIEEGPFAGDGRDSPLKSGLVAGFTLSDGEREDLIRFLESLTDERFLTDPRHGDPFADRQ